MPQESWKSNFLHHSYLMWYVFVIGSFLNLRTIYGSIWRNTKKHLGWSQSLFLMKIRVVALFCFWSNSLFTMIANIMFVIKTVLIKMFAYAMLAAIKFRQTSLLQHCNKDVCRSYLCCIAVCIKEICCKDVCLRDVCWYNVWWYVCYKIFSVKIIDAKMFVTNTFPVVMLNDMLAFVIKMFADTVFEDMWFSVRHLLMRHFYLMG